MKGKISEIDLENISEKEAEELLRLIGARFNLIGKTIPEFKEVDLINIYVRGEYDDGFHAKK